MKEITVTGKSIVELLYGGGDIVSEKTLFARAELGTIVHQTLQAKYKETDKKEVVVSAQEQIDDYSITVTGRMDGLIKRSNKLIIEEIKSTFLDFALLDENTYPVHLAQAKMYGYMYLKEASKKSVYIRLTYGHVESFKTVSFEKKYSFSELETFFFNTLQEYINWVKIIDHNEEQRTISIQGLKFPYKEYREGQREFMGACYKTIISDDILYAIAPTGIGKTIATIFSGLKAITLQEEKLFYLTAKNLGKKIALETIEMLNEIGLTAKTCEITAKDSMCFLGKERDCNPEKCEFAKGYYSRVFEAIKDVYSHEEIFDKKTIIKYAYKYRVCPFELSLDLSNYSDIIICDYNYAFCPRTHLIRYFDPDSKYIPILLVDEAHNMVNRSREMYSGSVSKLELKNLKKLLRGSKPSSTGDIKSVIDMIEEYENTHLAQVDYFVFNEVDDEFAILVKKLMNKIERVLADSEKNKQLKTNEIAYIYSNITRFYSVIELFNNNFIYQLDKDGEDTIVSIKCLDASEYILRTIKERTKSTVFFSATLTPTEYYRNLLTKEEGKIVQYLSPFDINNLKLIAIDDVSTRYNDRENSVEKIVKTMEILGNSKIGNYIVFFPSYKYLEMVKTRIDESNLDFTYIIQKRELSLEERKDYVELFKGSHDKSQFGLFVAGGMFSEGIDYLGDMLNGVIIVGTCLPMYGGYNNVLKSHFDDTMGNGFDYAYTYPGFNKVVQAVGRVIRSETDRGVAILIDDRFTTYKYKRMYPKEWAHLETINNLSLLDKKLRTFWKNK